MFLNKLERSPLLQNVVIIESKENAVINNIKLVNFEIRGATVFTEASLMEQGLPDVDLPSREEITKLVSAAAPTLAENLAKSREEQAAAL
jgi:hypothetical protein